MHQDVRRQFLSQLAAEHDLVEVFGLALPAGPSGLAGDRLDLRSYHR